MKQTAVGRIPDVDRPVRHPRAGLYEPAGQGAAVGTDGQGGDSSRGPAGEHAAVRGVANLDLARAIGPDDPEGDDPPVNAQGKRAVGVGKDRPGEFAAQLRFAELESDPPGCDVTHGEPLPQRPVAHFEAAHRRAVPAHEQLGTHRPGGHQPWEGQAPPLPTCGRFFNRDRPGFRRGVRPCECHPRL